MGARLPGGRSGTSSGVDTASSWSAISPLHAAEVLGQNAGVRQRVSRFPAGELDRLSSGIEAIAVVIEAVHPPAGAASAYRKVQAAQILANSQIAVQRATPFIRSIGPASAMEDRTRRRRRPPSSSPGPAAKASVRCRREARERDGEAFLAERRFERLATGLAKSESIVVDPVSMARMGRSSTFAASMPAAPARGAAARRDIVLRRAEITPRMTTTSRPASYPSRQETHDDPWAPSPPRSPPPRHHDHPPDLGRKGLLARYGGSWSPS